MAASGTTTFANNPSTTVATNGYNSGASTGDAPSSGTTETWTMASSTGFPSASSSAVPATQFCIADKAAPGEVIWVTGLNSGTNVWNVTRGAEGSGTVTHAAGATFVQIGSAGDLTSLLQATGANVAGASVHGTTTETVVATYQPVTGEIVAGTTYEINASGSVQITGTANGALTWTLRWGGVSGTSLLTLANGTNCTAFNASMSAVQPFTVNGSVTFISTTSAVAELNFSFGVAGTTPGVGVAANATAVTGLTAPPGGGPLVLTAKWTTTSTHNSLVVPAPAIFRVC